MREYVLVYDTGGGIKEVEVNEGVRRISGSSNLTTLESHLLEHAAILGSSYQPSSKEYIRVKNEGGGLRDVPVTQGVNFVRSYSNKVTFDGHLLEHTAMDNDTPLSISSNEYVLVYDTGGGSRQVPVIDGCLFIEGERYLSTYSDHNSIHDTTGLPPGLNIPAIGRTMLACLTSSLILDEGTGAPTWSRATKAWRFNELGYLEELASGCASFGGARLVYNHLRWTEDLANAYWVKTGSPTVTANTFKFNDQADRLRSAAFSVWNASGKYAFVFVISADAPLTVTLDIADSSDGSPEFPLAVNVTTTPTQYKIVGDFSAGTMASSAVAVFLNRLNQNPSVVGKTITLSNMRFVYVTGYDNSYVPEYVSVGVEASPYFGAGIDGAKYFETDWQGAPIPSANLLGFRRETAATNNLLYCRDLSNAAWSTKTNITANKTATGLDGIANTATTLTATAADAIILQPISLASAARCASAYVKRRTGTGTISFTQDGGSTWTDITSQINSSTWSRVEITSTLANPSVGFKISTSGDAIDVDCVQNEAGTIATSPIVTTTATVTRNAESLTYQTASNLSDTAGTAYIEVEPYQWSVGGLIGSATNGLLESASNSGATAYDGTNSANGPTGTPTGRKKLAMRWGDGAMTVASGGVLGTPGTYDGGMGLSSIGIAINSSLYCGNIAIYNYAMTDAELQGITS